MIFNIQFTLYSLYKEIFKKRIQHVSNKTANYTEHYYNECFFFNKCMYMHVFSEQVQK